MGDYLLSFSFWVGLMMISPLFLLGCVFFLQNHMDSKVETALQLKNKKTSLWYIIGTIAMIVYPLASMTFSILTLKLNEDEQKQFSSFLRLYKGIFPLSSDETLIQSAVVAIVHLVLVVFLGVLFYFLLLRTSFGRKKGIILALSNGATGVLLFYLADLLYPAVFVNIAQSDKVGAENAVGSTTVLVVCFWCGVMFMQFLLAAMALFKVLLAKWLFRVRLSVLPSLLYLISGAVGIAIVLLTMNQAPSFGLYGLLVFVLVDLAVSILLLVLRAKNQNKKEIIIPKGTD